jgi:hypothetical protein
VFHINLLKPFVPDDSESFRLAPPDPILVDGSEEYEIDRIIRSRKRGKSTQYLVRWSGYGPDEDSWLFESDFINAPNILSDYLNTQSGA